MTATEHTSAGDAVSTWKPVDITQIEHELDLIWEKLHGGSEGATGLTRASMSNLMIFCDQVEHIRDLTERIPTLVERHPARVLMVVASLGSNETLSAEVTAHCRRVGSGVQLCSEHINVYFSPDDVDRVASVIRPLLIGDLPTALWWACTDPPALRGQLFDVLADMSDQVIYDSIGWPNPAKGVQAMSRWVIGRRQPVFNLSWRRLKAWRRIIAQVLDPAVAPGALRSLDAIEIVHGPHALPMAWLLTGWLAARLDWKADQGKVRSGSEIGWNFKSRERHLRVSIKRLEDGPPQIKRLRMTWSQGDHQGYVTFLHADDARLRVDPEESTLPAAFVPNFQPPLELMVAAQLAHREKDPLFENAVEFAQTMAGVLR